MSTQTRRLAMVTAILWFAFGVGGRAEAGSIDLHTPMGLSPGDHFRFAFATFSETTATSSNLSDYDTFVTNQASGFTYNGEAISWSAIASTTAESAINHLGLTSDPVFLADGTEVTTSTTATGLWSGSLLHPINEDLSGVGVSEIVFTGTNPDGSKSFWPLGSPQVSIGLSIDSDASWIFNGAIFSDANEFPLYGISADLIVPQSVVPEPPSLWMAGTAISAGLAYG